MRAAAGDETKQPESRNLPGEEREPEPKSSSQIDAEMTTKPSIDSSSSSSRPSWFGPKRIASHNTMADTSSTEHYDPSKDPKRKAKSNDPGWKYGFWPDLANKDVVECLLCHRRLHSGVKRLKQHLIGGYGDVGKCANTTIEIVRELQQYMQQKRTSKATYTHVSLLGDSENEEFDDEGAPEDSTSQTQRQPSSHDSATIHPSSGTTFKRKRVALRFVEPEMRVGKQRKSLASMVKKTPEEVVEERHNKGATQRTLESFTKSKEEKERMHMHIANFFYECGIPFNAANSRSFEIMVESIGQVGPEAKPPSYHELRVPLLEKAVKETNLLKKKHMVAWKQYGCTLMSDGWTDQRNRHLINFLVNSPEGTFFLSSVDASSMSHDATMLSELLEKKILEVGKEHVVQVVTNNGANYKAAGRLLEERIPTLFWTPCVAQCLNLMLKDIGKLPEFKGKIELAKRVTTFIYRHGRILNIMREKTGGRDLVRPGATRFVTAFLTLQSLYKHKHALRKLFVSEDWYGSKLSKTEAGTKVCDIVLSSRFWASVEDCIRASHPLLVVLRIVNADEKPAMPELSMAMSSAKKKISESFANKLRILSKLMEIIEGRWTDQMEVKLYGAALFLNPSKYFELKASDNAYARRQRAMFNDVLKKMVTDDDLQAKISDQVDDYDNMGGSFGKQMAIKQQKTKNPLDWWNAFGGLHIELQSLAFRITGLCCSSSGCERNWSTFEFIHTKRRNRLEHRRLNDLVYVQYNRKITNRFQKQREKGSNFNPLILEEFQWDNEWVDKRDEVLYHRDDLSRLDADEAIRVSQNLEGLNFPRRSHVGEASGSGGASSASSLRLIDEDAGNEELEPFPNDDEDVEDEDDSLDPTLSDDAANLNSVNEGNFDALFDDI